MLLLNSHSRYEGTRLTEEGFRIHISALRQFFLDCYVISDHFMSLLMSPFRPQVWVSQSQFLSSFEEVQSRVLDPLALYAEDPHSIKKLLAMQKLLCKPYVVFFRVVEFASQGPLNWLEVQQVVRMTLKDTKNSEEIVVRVAARISDKLATDKPVQSVSFTDFYCAIKRGRGSY
jgi:hypothetical protein